MEKKSERLEVRLGFQEKQDFSEACEIQGDTPSGAIRRFINGYVKRSDGEILSLAWRQSAKRRMPKLTLLVVVLCAVGILAWVAYRSAPNPIDSQIFATIDVNQDGRLSGKELEQWEQGLLEVMDIDGSGDITSSEFVSKGYMAYIYSGVEDDVAQKFIPRDGQYITTLNFDITKDYGIVKQRETIEKDIYLSGKIKLQNLDRIVFSHEGGGITALNGPAGMAVNVGDAID